MSSRGPHLVLPLGGHDLGVDAADLHPGMKAGLVVSLDDVAPNGGSGASRAVVGALRTRVAARRPPKGPLGPGVEESVLLLDSEPRLVLLGLLHHYVAGGAGVGGDRLHRGHRAVLLKAWWLVAIAHRNDVAESRPG